MKKIKKEKRRKSFNQSNDDCQSINVFALFLAFFQFQLLISIES